MSLIVSIGTSPLKDNSLRKIHDTSSEIFGGINFCIDGEALHCCHGTSREVWLEAAFWFVDG